MRELKLLLPYLRRYRWTYVVGGLAIWGHVFLRVLVPHFLGDSIDELESATDAPASDVRGAVLESALWIVVAAAAGAAVRTWSRLLILGGSRRVVHDLRGDVFDRLLRLAPSFYSRNKTGEVMSRCVNDVRNVQGLMGPVYMYLAETAVMYAICIGMMVRISPNLLLIGVLPFPLFVWAARRLAGRIQVGSRAAQEKLAEISSKVDESLSGHMIIQTLTLEEFDFRRFATHCEDYRSLNLKVSWARGTLAPLMMGLAALATILVLWIGGPMVVEGDISLGEFVAMTFYLQMMAAPTGVLGFVISSLQRGAAALGRIRELVETEVTLVDPPAPRPVPSPLGTLSVRGLTARYAPPEIAEVDRARDEVVEPAADADGPRGAGREVLHGISFELAPGRTLAVVGHTGAGKTTLMRVLARELEVDRGQVFFDGLDVCDLPLSGLRERIGYVPQETFLFSRSVADNVALGRPGASREAIEKAVDDARLGNDLDQLPDGLDTMLGERGVNLSGGQRQRTALARVMLLEPELLLLDDTLSAVDSHTADEILERLVPMMRGRSTVVATHRISTAQHADHVLVLEDGRVVEEGHHDDLVERDGVYARLWRRQSQRARFETNGHGNGHGEEQP